jgi:hypothetical protein
MARDAPKSGREIREEIRGLRAGLVEAVFLYAAQCIAGAPPERRSGQRKCLKTWWIKK